MQKKKGFEPLWRWKNDGRTFILSLTILVNLVLMTCLNKYIIFALVQYKECFKICRSLTETHKHKHKSVPLSLSLILHTSSSPESALSSLFSIIFSTESWIAWSQSASPWSFSTVQPPPKNSSQGPEVSSSPERARGHCAPLRFPKKTRTIKA